MSHLDPTYKQWIFDLKEKVRSAQLKAAVAVNAQLIQLYWELGKNITEKQTAWGTGFLQQLSKDLSSEFPDMKGFSVRNLKYCRYFFQFYNSTFGQQVVAQNLQQPLADFKNIEKPDYDLQPHGQLSAPDEIRQQAVVRIPWGHNILIFTK